MVYLGFFLLLIFLLRENNIYCKFKRIRYHSGN